MANNIITEIDARGQVYDIYGKATVNTNDVNTKLPFVFNWIGTKQEYETQKIEESHPEWVCYITNDVDGLDIYTREESDEMYVHKTQNETINGKKTFLSQSDGIALLTRSQAIDNNVTPSAVQYSNYIDNMDKNNVLLSRIFTAKNTTGANVIALQAWKGSANYALQVTSDGTCSLPPNTYATNFYGVASSAKWADLAEKYKADKTYISGTLIKFGGEQEITIADTKCNGVISDKPGFLLNSEDEDSLPVALVGKTPIRIVGKVERFDSITLSEFPGIGRVAKDGEQVIAKALEASDNENEKLVMCVTKFNLD